MKDAYFLYINYGRDKKANKRLDKEIDNYIKKHNIIIKRKFFDMPDTQEKGLVDLINYSSIEDDVTKVLMYSRDNVSVDEVFVTWVEKELLKFGKITRYIVRQTLKDPELELLREKIIGAFARYEREKAPNKLAAHREYKIIETGIKASGNCPLGYVYKGKTSKDKKVVTVSREVELVKLIFEKYLELKSLGKLKDFLAEKNYKTKRGKKFSRQTLYNILTNKFYIGMLSYNYYKYIKIDGKKRKRAVLIEERRIEGKHEKIIDVDLFNKVNKILAENNKHKND